MAFSKIIFNGTTQIDLTQDTVIADKLYQNYTAHGADGEPITGTSSGGGSVEDKFITVTFNNHLETGGITLHYVSGTNLVNSSSGYVEMVSITSIQHDSSVTKLMPYGFGLAVRTSSLGGANAQNFDVQMNNTVIDPYIEGKYSTSYYKYYRISKTNLDSSNNVIDFYSTSEPFKDTVITDTLSVTVNDTYTAPLGTAYSEVTVNVQSNDFIITLSYNSTSEMWEPDCTYAEIQAAYVAEKNIVVTVDDYNGTGASADGAWDEGDNGFLYTVWEYNVDQYWNKIITESEYTLLANALNVDVYTEYETGQANTVESDVPAGKIFYNSTGRAVGTAPVRTSSDLTASGATVTAPAGYYAEAASKSVSSGSATTPATTITANPSISVNNSGLITASVSGSQNVTPTVSAGYVSTGTSGTITVSGSTTSQLSTVAGSTITPTESQQTAVAAGKYTTGAINVAAISSTYVGSGITRRTSSNLTVSGASVTAPAGYYETAASTSVASGTAGTPTAAKGTVSNHSISVTPSVTNTTGYITGSTKTGTAVTVSASELVSGSETKTANGTYDVTNLASLVVAVPIVTYYTGSSTPSSSLGSNGDIYLQTS